jgi:putative dimethyl sulfoxide reductase chaperone
VATPHHCLGFRWLDMKILVISANPLFREVLTKTILPDDEAAIEYLDPTQAITRIGSMLPEVLVIDDTIPTSDFNCILDLCRPLAKARLILISPSGNDFTILNSSRASIREVGDLMQAIGIELGQKNAPREDTLFQEMADHATAQAEMYSFLAAILNQRPDLDLVQRLRSIDGDSFSNSFFSADVNEKTKAGFSDMWFYIEQTAKRTEEEVKQELVVDWTRLFRALRPGYGPPPPYESAGFMDENATLAVLHSLTEYYVLNQEEIHNRADYLGLELEYLAYLFHNEAEAWNRRDEKAAYEIHQNAIRFYTEHPGKWVNNYCENAKEHASTPFFRGFLQVCQTMICDTSENIHRHLARGKTN